MHNVPDMGPEVAVQPTDGMLRSMSTQGTVAPAPAMPGAESADGTQKAAYKAGKPRALPEGPGVHELQGAQNPAPAQSAGESLDSEPPRTPVAPLAPPPTQPTHTPAEALQGAQDPAPVTGIEIQPVHTHPVCVLPSCPLPLSNLAVRPCKKCGALLHAGCLSAHARDCTGHRPRGPDPDEDNDRPTRRPRLDHASHQVRVGFKTRPRE